MCPFRLSPQPEILKQAKFTFKETNLKLAGVKMKAIGDSELNDWSECTELTTIISLLLIMKQGTTRLLLTRIPFFKEIILMSFECPHCGFTNNEIQSAGRIQEKGCTMKLSVCSPKVQVLWELTQILKNLWLSWKLHKTGAWWPCSYKQDSFWDVTVGMMKCLKWSHMNPNTRSTFHSTKNSQNSRVGSK